MLPRLRVAAVLTATIVLLAGYVSQPTALGCYMRSNYRNSAGDSSILRPALCVVAVGSGPRYNSASYSGGNLWGRVRARMGLGIKIVRTRDGGQQDNEGLVEFVARYKIGGRAHRKHRVSRFVRKDGRWLYVSGKLAPSGQEPLIDN